jgi:single-strand DNA-binding protein
MTDQTVRRAMKGNQKMAGSVNKVILIGNVGRDPEVHHTAGNASKIVKFSLATSETWRDKETGERREKTEWHNVVIFNENLGKIVESYVKKGSKIYLEGQLQTRHWNDRDGNARSATDIVLQRGQSTLAMLDNKPGAQDRSVYTLPKDDTRTSAEIIDDDLPF